MDQWKVYSPVDRLLDILYGKHWGQGGHDNNWPRNRHRFVFRLCCNNLKALVERGCRPLLLATGNRLMSQPAQPKLFKYRHFESEIILLCLRRYLRYALSYRDLEEMMVERGLCVDQTTIYRWVQHYAPILEKKCRVRLRSTNDSWRVDETYVKVKGTWMYLYRAVNSVGNTVEFMLSPTRDGQAAKRFF